MPNWHSNDENLKNHLNSVWGELDLEISANPSFEEVVGISVEEMSEHAAAAVRSFMERTPKPSPAEPASLIQVYLLGFIVGMKYGMERASGTPSRD